MLQLQIRIPKQNVFTSEIVSLHSSAKKQGLLGVVVVWVFVIFNENRRKRGFRVAPCTFLARITSDVSFYSIPKTLTIFKATIWK